MSDLSFDDLPAAAMALALGVYFLGGILLGLLYFGSLWWNVRVLAAGGQMMTSLALTIGRFAAVGGVLVLASREGATPLLALAGGILVGRALVMRRFRESAA